MVRCLDLLAGEVVLDLLADVGRILEVVVDVHHAWTGGAPAKGLVLGRSGLLLVPRDLVLVGSDLSLCDLRAAAGWGSSRRRHSVWPSSSRRPEPPAPPPAPPPRKAPPPPPRSCGPSSSASASRSSQHSSPGYAKGAAFTQKEHKKNGLCRFLGVYPDATNRSDSSGARRSFSRDWSGRRRLVRDWRRLAYAVGALVGTVVAVATGGLGAAGGNLAARALAERGVSEAVQGLVKGGAFEAAKPILENAPAATKIAANVGLLEHSALLNAGVIGAFQLGNPLNAPDRSGL